MPFLFSLLLFSTLFFPNMLPAKTHFPQDALLEAMQDAGWSNIEIDECRVRFTYGTLPQCENGAQQFFEQDFRLYNLDWDSVGPVEILRGSDATYFMVVVEPDETYENIDKDISNVSFEIRKRFPESAWPNKNGVRINEVSDYFYSQIPRSSPVNWWIWHNCFGEVPGLQSGLTMVFGTKVEANRVTEALVSYSKSQECTPN